MAPDDPKAWIANSTNIYRNDQGICWKILDPTQRVAWRATDPFVFTDDKWQTRGGTTPQPLGTELPPLMVAMGPGANMDAKPERFEYMIYIVVEGEEVAVNSNVPIDPDVWNQPQP